MNYIVRHISSIIDTYQLQMPLHYYIKNYLKSHKQLGSRDRRAITDAVYAYYRVAKWLPKDLPLAWAIPFCLKATNNENAFLKKIFPQEPSTDVKIDDNISFLNFSNNILKEKYYQSILQQPDVFIRFMRSETSNYKKLQKLIPEATVEDTPFLKNKIVRIPANSKLQNILQEPDYVIQDLASQMSLQIALPFIEQIPNYPTLSVWDVCCGAGGKSILLKSLCPKATILATDIRQSIIENYKQRMKLYGIENTQAKVSNSSTSNQNELFDTILCDVPCSGSGTWARTPEYFYFFDEKSIQDFANNQYNIANNSINQLKQKGIFCYITCSVFKQENEDVVERLLQNNAITLLHQQIINGTEQKSDSMFVAVLQKK